MGCGQSSSVPVAAVGVAASVSGAPSKNNEVVIKGQQQDKDASEHDEHDLDIGAKLGSANVSHIPLSRVTLTLLNLLALDDDDIRELSTFCDVNKSHAIQGDVNVKEKDRVFCPKQPHDKHRKRYVIWLHVDEHENSLSVFKRLNHLISFSLVSDSGISSQRRRAEQATLDHDENEAVSSLDNTTTKRNTHTTTDPTLVMPSISESHLSVDNGVTQPTSPFSTLTNALEHFRHRFLPIHVCVVLEDPYQNKSVADDMSQLSSDFTVIITDSDDKIKIRRQMKQTKSTAHLAALEKELSTDDEASKPDLVILHFNDVYHIQATRTTDPVGGADRFYTCVKNHLHDQPLILFSGDAFSPSTLSSVTKGSHMPPVLNKVGIHCSMIGNHDLDFGVDVCTTLVNRCNFPWLLSNVFDKGTGKPLANSNITKILDWHGIKIGILALAEKEWIDTLPRLPPGGVSYLDFIEEGGRLARELRSNGADLVVALTHCRLPNDLLLAEKVPEIDLVLGGHDHSYHVSHEKSGVSVIKSGTDFRNLTRINLWLKNHPRRSASTTPSPSPSPSPPSDAHIQTRFAITTQRFDVTNDIEPDEEMRQLVVSLAGEVDKNMVRPLGRVEVVLDATFETARTRESNVGNFIADIIRRAYKADIGLICGGAIRADDTYPPAEMTMQTILDIFPFEDPCVVVSLTGAQLWATIENGVSSYPKMDGRFPQVSGMRFVYDPARPPGNRVLSIHVGDTVVSPTSISGERYSVATRHYMAQGNDGFKALAEGEILMDDENGHTLAVLMRNFFWSVAKINRMHAKKRTSADIGENMKLLKLDSHYSDHSSPLRIAPQVEGRILTMEQAKTASVHVTQLSAEVADFAAMKQAPFSPTPDKRTIVPVPEPNA